MKYEHWQIPAAPEDAIKTLMDAGYPYLVSSVLAARGVTTSEQAAEALEREKTLAHSPFLMKDMDKAVARISKALENGEKLAVFGDYDVDGITSTCLLTDYLRSRGADVTMHIPRRIEEGYGLGCDAIRALSESGVTLIVTVDCGITGVDETAYAATLGVDLVITDHHECKEQLPAAVAVVDPHRPDCPYPFKHLAGVGVALKLVLALGEGREDALFARYCTLAAIGTIADVMRMEGENRTIVQCGLESIDRSDFTGLHALLREAGLTSRPISSIQIGFVLAPRINAAGRMGRAELAAELLLTDDPVRAEKLARELCASRVSMGTVFQIPWTYFDKNACWPDGAMDVLHKLGYKTAAMALRDDSVSIDDEKMMAEEKLAIVLGTEGDGLADHTIADCDYTVKIPMTHGVDSLNVAAASAVAFWQLGMKCEQ